MFSNGTTPDSAIGYRDPRALCGASTPDAPVLNNAQNAANLTLPLNTPGCTQRISMTWVAKVTNWLAFLYDRAGLPFAPGAACDDPLLLYKAVKAVAAPDQDTILFEGPMTGSGAAFVAKLTPAPTADRYGINMRLTVGNQPNTANTTLDFGFGPKPLVINATNQPFAGNEFIPNAAYTADLFYDGQRVRLLNPQQQQQQVTFPSPGNVFPVNGYCFCVMVTNGASPTINEGDILPIGQPYPNAGGAALYVGSGTSYLTNQPPGTFMCIGVTEIYEGGGNNYWTVLAIRIA